MVTTVHSQPNVSFRLVRERTARAMLERVGLLDFVPDGARRVASEAMYGRMREFGDGETILAAGQDGVGLWLLCSGAVTAKDGMGRTFRWPAPTVVGEDSLLRADGVHRITVRADGPVSAILIPLRAIERLRRIGLADAFWRGFGGAVARRSSAAPVSGPRVACATRHVVVMFTDVIGFSKIAGAITGAGSVLLLARVMARQADEIQSRGGQIDKVVGDGLMAFWDIPPGVDPSETCVRALDAARAACAAVAEIPSPLEPDGRMALRVGMHVGIVAQGDLGHGLIGGSTLFGDAVNVACRMEQARAMTDRGDSLGPVRASEAFWHNLPVARRSALPLTATVKVKGQRFVIRSGRTESTGASERPA